MYTTKTNVRAIMKYTYSMKQSQTPQADDATSKGEATRRAILNTAVNIASVEGLEGLTIGRLAQELRMSKSGLFAHFGSKEDLQLATIEFARQVFIDRVMRPALVGSPGVARLWRLCDAWLTYVEKKVFKGGCFFTAASFEFDSRAGRVRDRIAEIMAEWIEALTRAVREAQKRDEIDVKLDASQLAFEINSIALGAHWAFQILHDRNAYRRARAIIRLRLEGAKDQRAKRNPGDDRTSF
jgi:AcrR family transcriptional regulator